MRPPCWRNKLPSLCAVGGAWKCGRKLFYSAINHNKPIDGFSTIDSANARTSPMSRQWAICDVAITSAKHVLPWPGSWQAGFRRAPEGSWGIGTKHLSLCSWICQATTSWMFGLPTQKLVYPSVSRHPGHPIANLKNFYVSLQQKAVSLQSTSWGRMLHHPSVHGFAVLGGSANSWIGWITSWLSACDGGSSKHLGQQSLSEVETKRFGKVMESV